MLASAEPSFEPADAVVRNDHAERRGHYLFDFDFRSSPEVTLADAQDARVTLAALAELPAACRWAFLLSRIDGQSSMQIAQRLGVTERAVRKYLARALFHLQTRFDLARVMKRESIQAEAAERLVTLNDPAASQADFADSHTWMSRDPAHAEAFRRLEETWRRSGAVVRAPVESEVELALSTPDIEPSPRSHVQRRCAIAAAAMFAFACAALTVWNIQPPTIATGTAEVRSMEGLIELLHGGN
ncbi:sigma factor-like helix-turn-helix DNA-binding protein [Steroidobacter sp.]|uniref:sigma factor-like helix-turn-helix DNA-binding protein n=1 Tax=Steroidobacter sp. TaxID=1978227 RepID=UPI001A3F2242|nr:sigma factor-like helix-turn-helix DNA-binding protein [Steroidobacter sp.]MBL8269060.1 DUF4880 domain-containing protein [Steroidobacter sp.]